MRSQGLDSYSFIENKQEHFLITRICCTDVVSRLRRLPAGFYVAVETNGTTTETSNSYAYVDKDTVEWNDEILLPAERSSTVSFKVYASFEFGARLGDGELIGQIELTVGEVLSRNDQTPPFWFLVLEQNDAFPSCLSLRIVTERRISEVDESAIKDGLSLESDAMIQLARLTNTGHQSLSRYRQLGDAKDLDEAIVCFERVRDECPPDYPDRSAVQLNLATAKFILCQVNDAHFELDEPISLYRDALHLRNHNHPDYYATALDLSFALLARFHGRLDEADKTEAMALLTRVTELSPKEGYTHRAACFALRMARIPISNRVSGVSRVDSADSDDEELIQKVQALILNLPHQDPRRLVLLSDLGTLLHRRFSNNRKLDDSHEAISMLQNAVQVTSDECPNKPVLLNSLGSVLLARFEQLGTLLDINMSILVLKEAEHLAPNGHPHRPFSLNNLGKSLLHRFEQLGDIADVNKSVSVLEEAVNLTSSGDPEKPVRLNNLGHSLSRRFERLGNLADINKSISLSVEALRLVSNGHSEQPALLKNLGTSLLNRFVCFGNLEDIHMSISILEGATNVTSDSHPQKPAQLNNLGNALTRRFERLGDVADINKSVSVFKRALHLTPDDHRSKPARLSNLGNVFMRRFEHLGNIEDIVMSVSMREEAVRLTPEGHPDRPTWLCTLGDSLFFRFERLGDIVDLNRSVVMKEEAVQLTPDGHVDKPFHLNNLGSSLNARFERLGDFADLKKSISVKEEALCLTPDGHPAKPVRMGNLGNSLLKRFQHLGDLADLNKSISILEGAVHLTPDGHPEVPRCLNNLGDSLHSRFECLGDLADLNESISLKEEATRLTPDHHPDKPRWLNNLAKSVLCRFELLGNLDDINKSIAIFKHAVRLTPNDHPSKPAWMCGLGGSFLYRFERRGDIEDMNNSVSILEGAVNLIPTGHPNKLHGLNNLGNVLYSRFKRLGDQMDIHRSVSTLEEAVRLNLDGHPMKPSLLNSLGRALLRRFICLKDTVDIDSSILMLEEAVRLTPSGHSDRPIWLRNLGSAFLTRFELSRDPSNLSSATRHLSEAARSATGPTFSRFLASRDWISSAHLEGNTQTLLEACTTAIGLLPQLAWIGHPLSERHRVLLDAADVARDAAAVALDAGLLDKAIEWLEQGRSIVWSQFFQLRAPVDRLRVEHRALADRFQQISRELEHASSRGNATFYSFVDEAEAISLEKEVQRHQHLALTREKLLVEIRSLPGFDRFLLPRTIEELTTLAYSGPVVYVNASKHRCDALIVKANPRKVIPVFLSGITYSEVVQLKDLLRVLLKRGHLIISHDDISPLVPGDGNWVMKYILDQLAGGDRSDNRAVKVKPQRIEGYSPDDLFRSILEYLWNKVVHPIVEALGLSTLQSDVDVMTRIFWCLTGPFSFLPLHAAGLYGTATTGTKLSDFAISSYIPTLSALAASARNDSSAPSSNINIRILCVPQPPTDGLKWLGLVREEMNHVKRLSASSLFVTIQESDGTVEDTVEKMKNSDWVHFACHGIQDPEDPLASGLCLADGRRLKLFDIVRLSRPRGGGKGGLAFLSACQTAQGDEKLPEESVHLAAGMLLAGYDSVVATMWSIMDDDAPRVASGVYEHLFRNGKVPDTKDAAAALHRAVQRLRDSGASFASWVPFIYVGR